ncbi:MAG: hypothetical protein AB7O78_01640 [Thermoleophilia bacterium]
MATEPPYPIGAGAPVPMALYIADRERDQRDREAARRDQDRRFDDVLAEVREVRREVGRLADHDARDEARSLGRADLWKVVAVAVAILGGIIGGVSTVLNLAGVG